MCRLRSRRQFKGQRIRGKDAKSAKKTKDVSNYAGFLAGSSSLASTSLALFFWDSFLLISSTLVMVVLARSLLDCQDSLAILTAAAHASFTKASSARQGTKASRALVSLSSPRPPRIIFLSSLRLAAV